MIQIELEKKLQFKDKLKRKERWERLPCMTKARRKIDDNLPISWHPLPVQGHATQTDSNLLKILLTKSQLTNCFYSILFHSNRFNSTRSSEEMRSVAQS